MGRYVVFAVLFTIITFVNKPGEVRPLGQHRSYMGARRPSWAFALRAWVDFAFAQLFAALQDLYWHNQNLKNIILQKPQAWTTNMFSQTFYDIGELPDGYDWLHDVLIGSIYNTNVPYGDDGDPFENHTKVLGTNFLLGGIRLRQIRTRLAPCLGPPGMNVTECIPKYDDDLCDDMPFGPINGTDGVGEFRWSNMDEPVAGLYSSLFGMTYTKDGYVPNVGGA
jgi:hypothetical protein